MSRIWNAVKSFTPVRNLMRTADRIVLPGFEGLSLLQFSRFFLKQIGSTKLNERVAAVTYNLMMAIPPTLLFLFSLIPYLPISNVQETILSTLKLVISSKQLYQDISNIIVDFMTTRRTDVLSFGILMVLFFSSNGMMGLMRSFDRSLSIYKERSELRRRWTAIKLTFMLICVVIVAIAVIILQTSLLNVWLEKIFGGILPVRITSLVVLALIIFMAISLVYTYGPSLSHKFKFVSPGSVMATLLIIIVTTVFFYLANNFIHYNQVYGSLGTVIAFMVWMWLNTLIILLGYELNVSILLGKISRNENEEEETARGAKHRVADDGTPRL